MKKIIFSISIFLLWQDFINAQQQVLTAVERIPLTAITVTSPGATTNVYPGSLITCTWTCTNDIPFGARVKVLLVSQAQRTDLLAKMSRMGNLVPVDSIGRVLFIKTSTDAYSLCNWDVPVSLVQGNYAVVVSHGSGKLGVGPVFTVNSIPSTPNILSYYPVEKGSVFGGTITFSGRDIKPEAVQVFIGTNRLEILSATEGQVVAKISGTQAGPLKIGHGQPSNTVTLENNFRPIGQPIITGVQPLNITNGTEVSVTGTNLDFVELKRHTLFEVDSTTKLYNMKEDEYLPKNIFSSGEFRSNYFLTDQTVESAFKEELPRARKNYLDKRNTFVATRHGPEAGPEAIFKMDTGYRTLGPSLISIEEGSFKVNKDGTKITFKVKSASQSIDKIHRQYDELGNLNSFFRFGPESETKSSSSWKLKFVTVDGRQQVISPNLVLRWTPPPPTQEPPPPPLNFIKIVGQNDSNNFVLVRPEQPTFISIVGKGLKGAVVKLNRTVLASYLQGETVNGIYQTTDSEGNQKLTVVIPFSANSGFIEISNEGQTIKVPQKLIIVPQPRITSISHTTSVPVNTDITIRGFDFVAPAEAKGISFIWLFIGVFDPGFTYKVVSSDQNTHVFRIEMAPGTPVVRRVTGIGNNVSVFGGGPGSLKFQLQLRQTDNTLNPIKYYNFFLTQ